MRFPCLFADGTWQTKNALAIYEHIVFFFFESDNDWTTNTFCAIAIVNAAVMLDNSEFISHKKILNKVNCYTVTQTSGASTSNNLRGTNRHNKTPICAINANSQGVT